MTTDPRDALLNALADYRQCDDDGRMCIVSRQAVDEAIAALRTPRPESDARDAEIDRLQAEVELCKETIHDEMAANLAFREAGGALPDEDMPTFLARLIAERAALRAQLDAQAEESRKHSAIDAALTQPEATR